MNNQRKPAVTPAVRGLTVQELKAMTAMRLAQDQEFLPSYPQLSNVSMVKRIDYQKGGGYKHDITSRELPPTHGLSVQDIKELTKLRLSQTRASSSNNESFPYEHMYDTDSTSAKSLKGGVRYQNRSGTTSPDSDSVVPDDIDQTFCHSQLQNNAKGFVGIQKRLDTVNRVPYATRHGPIQPSHTYSSAKQTNAFAILPAKFSSSSHNQISHPQQQSNVIPLVNNQSQDRRSPLTASTTSAPPSMHSPYFSKQEQQQILIDPNVHRSSNDHLPTSVVEKHSYETSVLYSSTQRFSKYIERKNMNISNNSVDQVGSLCDDEPTNHLSIALDDVLITSNSRQSNFNYHTSNNNIIQSGNKNFYTKGSATISDDYMGRLNQLNSNSGNRHENDSEDYYSYLSETNSNQSNKSLNLKPLMPDSASYTDYNLDRDQWINYAHHQCDQTKYKKSNDIFSAFLSKTQSHTPTEDALFLSDNDNEEVNLNKLSALVGKPERSNTNINTAASSVTRSVLVDGPPPAPETVSSKTPFSRFRKKVTPDIVTNQELRTEGVLAALASPLFSCDDEHDVPLVSTLSHADLEGLSLTSPTAAFSSFSMVSPPPRSRTASATLVGDSKKYNDLLNSQAASRSRTFSGANIDLDSTSIESPKSLRVRSKLTLPCPPVVRSRSVSDSTNIPFDIVDSVLSNIIPSAVNSPTTYHSRGGLTGRIRTTSINSDTANDHANISVNPPRVRMLRASSGTSTMLMEGLGSQSVGSPGKRNHGLFSPNAQK